MRPRIKNRVCSSNNKVFIKHSTTVISHYYVQCFGKLMEITKEQALKLTEVEIIIKNE